MKAEAAEWGGCRERGLAGVEQQNLHTREATQPLSTLNAKETAKDYKQLSKRAKNGTILVKERN